MNDGEAILAAILEEPTVDVHRLVYADFLEEQGQSDRAEFIRLQCLLEQPIAPGAETWRHHCLPTHPYLARERDLWESRDEQGRWLIDAEPWPADARVHGMVKLILQDYLANQRTAWGIIWRRGFPDCVRASLAVLLEHGRTMRRQHPLTRLEPIDKRPWQGRDHPEAPLRHFGWWGNEDRPEREYDLPPQIMRILKDEPRQHPTPQAYRPEYHLGCVMFDTPELANEALSDALLVLTRKEVT